MNNKYSKYLFSDLSKKPPHPEVKTPIADFSGVKDWGETKFGINWECIYKPFYMIKEPHSHAFDEYLAFKGRRMFKKRIQLIIAIPDRVTSKITLCRLNGTINDKTTVIMMKKNFMTDAIANEIS